MTLSKLLQGVVVTKMFQTLYGRMVVTHDVEVRRIEYDSRKIGRRDLFVAIKGNGVDGHEYITSAVNNGASVVVMENDTHLPDSYFMHAGVVKIVVPDTRTALARIAGNYYNHPADRLVMVGVTGTNGKTTVTHLIQSILEHAGKPSGLIGTIEYRIKDDVYPATHTTPESLELQELFHRMKERGCDAAVMEVSSHALDQRRVEGVSFQTAVFTNLTQDHLDYHSTLEEYASAKRILFSSLGADASAVINADDPWASFMTAATKAKTISFGVSDEADIKATNVSLSVRGTKFAVRYGGADVDVESSLIGRFNVSNILAAFAAGVSLGIAPDVIRGAVNKIKAVRGRFEQYTAPSGWTAVIDYAHTPDALLKALTAVKEIFEAGTRGRIITVFGCGGNRDKTKRPKMAAIATEHSDVTIVTSDNPRHEDPAEIIREVLTGSRSGSEVHSEVDREKAIVRALTSAKKGDVILIAGKGHEEYQVVGNEKLHFSDREVVEKFIRSHA